MAKEPEQQSAAAAESVQAVARRLREARRATGLTQAEVAKRIGVNRRAVHEWEAGTWQPHRAIPDLAEVYGVSASFLLFGVEPASVELAAVRAQLLIVVDEVQSINARMGQLLALAEVNEAALGLIRAWIEGQQGHGAADA
jgi:transcriptional regulator with XRE-family HTH domain